MAFYIRKSSNFMAIIYVIKLKFKQFMAFYIRKSSNFMAFIYVINYIS